MEPATSSKSLPLSRLLWWTLFACAFGYVEAATVVYLRRAAGMQPGMDYSAILAARGVPFSASTMSAEMARAGVLPLELTREAATILLLLGAAWAAGRDRREKLGLFGYTFAVWDLSYYLVLALWIGFPSSLFQTDVYFLIPFAWYGPVWFPVLVFMPSVIFLSLRLLRPAPRTVIPEPAPAVAEEAPSLTD